MRTTRIALMLLVIAAGTLLSGAGSSAFGQAKEELAAKVRDLFKANCLECHGDKFVKGGVKILDRELLVSKSEVVPGNAEDSQLYTRITATDESVMPPAGRP